MDCDLTQWNRIRTGAHSLEGKLFGHYTRMDVVSLNLCQDEDLPVRYVSRVEERGAGPAGDAAIRDELQKLQESQMRITEELANLRNMLSRDPSRIRT